MVEHESRESLSDQLLQPGTAQLFTIAHVGTPHTSSAAVKHDQLCFPEQSSAPPMFTQGTDALAQGADALALGGSCCLE